MVIPATRNNPSYYYRASPTLSIALNASGLTLCSIHAITTIRVTHRNGAIKHIFYTNQIHGGSSADCSLFILSLHTLALHLAVKILLQIFLYEDLSVGLTYICQFYVSSRMYTHFVTQPILLVKTFLIFDINHQQNTRGQTNWNDKNDNPQTTRPRITWKVYQWLRLPFLKNVDQVRKDLDIVNCLFWTKTSQQSHCYLLSSHR